MMPSGTASSKWARSPPRRSTGTTAPGTYSKRVTARAMRESNNVYLDGRPVAPVQSADSKMYFLHDRLGAPQIATSSTQAPLPGRPRISPSARSVYPLTHRARPASAGAGSLPGDTASIHNGFRDYLPDCGRKQASELLAVPVGVALAGRISAFASWQPTTISETRACSQPPRKSISWKAPPIP